MYYTEKKISEDVKDMSETKEEEIGDIDEEIIFF